MRWCTCRQCKSARRLGLILGSRYMNYWRDGVYNHSVSVSDYVQFPKWRKGKRIKRLKNKEIKDKTLD